MKKNLLVLATFFLVTACAGGATIDPYDYTTYRDQDPQSILVVPVVNSSNEAEAADFFLTTIPYALGEKGYYVFPVNMVKRTMEADGLADPSLVHSADPVRLGALFNADTVLYVEILKWDSSYAVVSASITVSFRYTIKSAKTGAMIWQNEQTLTHSDSANSGNFLADLIVNAIDAAIKSTSSDYTPHARAANANALYTVGRGIPAGPYSPLYNDPKDLEAFPKTGSGWLGGPKPDQPVAKPANGATPTEPD